MIETLSVVTITHTHARTNDRQVVDTKTERNGTGRNERKDFNAGTYQAEMARIRMFMYTLNLAVLTTVELDRQIKTN